MLVPEKIVRYKLLEKNRSQDVIVVFVSNDKKSNVGMF